MIPISVLRGEEFTPDVNRRTKVSYVLPFPLSSLKCHLFNRLSCNRSTSSNCSNQYSVQLLYVWTIVHKFYGKTETPEKRHPSVIEFTLILFFLNLFRLTFRKVDWSRGVLKTPMGFFPLKLFDGVRSPQSFCTVWLCYTIGLILQLCLFYNKPFLVTLVLFHTSTPKKKK